MSNADGIVHGAMDVRCAAALLRLTTAKKACTGFTGEGKLHIIKNMAV